ncbi:DUF7079 family protein [Gilliamella apicola]|uniref:DUF7079 family protein n=1 Tax=Gilliamella apicola TaxID=1196095 RepID=UPI002FEDFADD
MEHTLNEEDLYVTLSDLFAASNIDYENIASVARQFPIKYVESISFNYIAPICHYNVITSYCMAFDSTSIINAVNNIKKMKIVLLIESKFVFWLSILSLNLRMNGKN